jgi:hypothetical protein
MRKKLNCPTPLPNAALPRVVPAPLDALRRMLASYAPDEPLGPPEGDILTPQGIPAARKKWPKSVFDTREKFPGYQPGYEYRENMKYGRCPDDDAPLHEWITARINHAKAKWSGHIDGRRTKLQFVEWLPTYLNDDGLRWHVGKMDAATEFLREKYGMPSQGANGRVGK